jgi:protein ImuA
MQLDKTDIIARLQKEILPLQGLKQPTAGTNLNLGLGPIETAFPNSSFPVGAMHEFISAGPEYAAATGGFVAGILAALMRNGGVSVWISSSRTLFPPALKIFDIEPDRIIFIDLQKEKDILWTMEEALKCEGLAAVVGELTEISFTASRRFQLAVEQSRVTGFILRRHSRNLNTIASVSRWKISPLPSEPKDNMPGVGFPRWNVELLKIRNGKSGIWQVEWSEGKFRHITPLDDSIPQEQKRKTG